MRSEIRADVREIFNKRYGDELGKVPEDPNSEAFTEYLQKLRDKGLSKQAITLEQAIVVKGKIENPVERAKRISEGRNRLTTTFKQLVFVKDDTGEWIPSKPKIAVLGFLALGTVAFATVFMTPSPNTTNITQNKAAEEIAAAESAPTGSAVAGTPLEVGSESLAASVPTPEEVAIPGQEPLQAGEGETATQPMDEQLTQQAENTAAANQPGDLPLTEATVSEPPTSYGTSYSGSSYESPGYDNSALQTSEVVPTPVPIALPPDNASTPASNPGIGYDSPGSANLTGPSSNEVVIRPVTDDQLTGSLTPGGELAEAKPSNMYTRPPKTVQPMSVKGNSQTVYSAQGQGGGSGELNAPTGQGEASSGSAPQNKVQSSSNPYRRATVTNSMNMLSASKSNTGGSSESQGGGSAEASTSNNMSVTQKPSATSSNMGVVNNKLSGASLQVQQGNSKGGASLQVQQGNSKGGASLQVQKSASSNQGTLQVVNQPKVQDNKNVIYQKQPGEQGAMNSASAVPNKVPSSSMTGYNRSVKNTSLSQMQASTQEVQASGGMGVYKSNKQVINAAGGDSTGGSKVVYDRNQALAPQVAASVNQNASVVAPNAVAGSSNPLDDAQQLIRQKFGYAPGNFVEAELITELVTAESAACPVVLRTSDGNIWIGVASTSEDRRVQVSLARLVASGVEYPVQGMVFSTAGAPGLEALFEDHAPTLSQDALRAGINGVSEFVENLANQKTVTQGAGGQLSQNSGLPSLPLTIAGNVAGLAKLPDRPVFVNVVRVPKGTKVLVAYGISAITGR